MDFTAAKEYLKKRLQMPTDMASRVISEEIPAQVRAHCFFSARVAEGNVLDRLRGISDAYGNGEIDLATARMKFKKWYDQKKPGQRFEDGEGITNISSTMRLDLVMRQNAAMAAGVGRYQVSRDPEIEERWPCWRYITGPNPRDAHAALDGKVFLKSDPVWHRIYPPWEFNCNCDVEDAELPEKGADKIKAEAVPESDSGFRFDPAEAFRKFDLALLNDQDTIDFELAYGGAAKQQNNILYMMSGSNNRVSSDDLGMASATTWNLPAAPGKIDAATGAAQIKAGFSVTDVRGVPIEFGEKITEHWDGKRQGDVIGRYERLPWAIDTVKNPAEIWTDLTQDTYVKAYTTDKKPRGVVVAVKHTGEVNTYYLDKLKRLDKARKGIRVTTF